MMGWPRKDEYFLRRLYTFVLEYARTCSEKAELSFRLCLIYRLSVLSMIVLVLAICFKDLSAYQAVLL